MQRAGVAVVLAGLVLAGTAGCGNDGNDKDKGNGVAKVSGNCALDKDSYQLSPLSAELLEKTLGDGTYTVTGDVSGSGKAGDPRDGGCTYSSVDEDGNATLRLQLSAKSKDTPFSDYQEQADTLASGEGITKIDGGQGYVRVEKNDAYGGGTGEGGAGVIIDGDMVYGATIVVPGKDIDGKKACEELVLATAKALSAPLQHK